MTQPEPPITVRVDVTNPGQFFACCGLLELADRLWPGAEGWFEDGRFCIANAGALADLLDETTTATLEQLDPDDEMASPVRLGEPFDLVLDWWTDELTHGKQLKVWAGSMRNVRIARAMQKAAADVRTPTSLFDYAAVVFDPHQSKKKVEPYYFDSRRGWNAQSRDVGFAPDSLKMTTFAYPAVELFCLIGIQRFRPVPTEYRRVFDYHVWNEPLPVLAASVAMCGSPPVTEAQPFRFENAFRTAQKKHKSFLPATPIGLS